MEGLSQILKMRGAVTVVLMAVISVTAIGIIVVMSLSQPDYSLIRARDYLVEKYAVDLPASWIRVGSRSVTVESPLGLTNTVSRTDTLFVYIPTNSDRNAIKLVGITKLTTGLRYLQVQFSMLDNPITEDKLKSFISAKQDPPSLSFKLVGVSLILDYWGFVKAEV